MKTPYFGFLASILLIGSPGPSQLHAAPHPILAPPAFELPDGDRAVYGDLVEAHYGISIDINQKNLRSRDTLEFTLHEEGRPVFDLVPEPRSVLIDGIPARLELIEAPGKETRFRVLGQKLGQGSHTLVVEHGITSGMRFESGQAFLGFFLSDLDDRQFLEQYLTTGFEYDTHRISMEIGIIGSSAVHRVFTNGAVTESGLNQWNLIFPEYFSASSVYLHIGPGSAYRIQEEFFTSSDGRLLPLTVYTRPDHPSAADFMRLSRKYLEELERDYGPFPHEQILVYGVGVGYGGMEYCGATITSIGALGHELTHSYFARGVMPADGNSGWIDEAIASWRDSGYKRITTPGFEGSAMGAHSPYRRTTDRRAYREGRDFLAFLDFLFTEKGGLRPRLKDFFTTHRLERIRTEHFQDSLQAGNAKDLGPLFDRYIRGGRSSNSREEDAGENPMHPRLSREKLRELL